MSDESKKESEETKAPESAKPADLMKRVEALGGGEDESDRIARLEEEKLAERRKGRTDLESAASKRLAKIGTKQVKRVAVAKPLEDDPLLARTKKLSSWAKDNPTIVRVGGALLALFVIGGAVFATMQNRSKTGASDMLTAALNADRGRVSDKDDEENGPKTPHATFKSAEARREAALAKYAEVRTKFPGSGAAILARLAEGSLLLDKRDADGAVAAYNEVKSSALAQADNEVRGRTLEGLGFAREIKAVLSPSDSEKQLDAALDAYKELEHSVEVKGFKELAMYHQARVYEGKGDKDKAKELLKAARERVAKPGESHPFPFLEEAVTDRLRALDPSAVPARKNDMMGGGNMDIEKLMKQYGGKLGGAGH